MNKPDWKDAPGWANYLAQDSEPERWVWYEDEPMWGGNGHEWTTEGKWEIASGFNGNLTLEKRPS